MGSVTSALTRTRNALVKVGSQPENHDPERSQSAPESDRAKKKSARFNAASQTGRQSSRTSLSEVLSRPDSGGGRQTSKKKTSEGQQSGMSNRKVDIWSKLQQPVVSTVLEYPTYVEYSYSTDSVASSIRCVRRCFCLWRSHSAIFWGHKDTLQGKFNKFSKISFLKANVPVSRSVMAKTRVLLISGSMDLCESESNWPLQRITVNTLLKTKVFTEWILSSLKTGLNAAYLHSQTICLMFALSLRLKWTNIFTRAICCFYQRDIVLISYSAEGATDIKS